MMEDAHKIGITMRARTGDMGLPHDRPFERALIAARHTSRCSTGLAQSLSRSEALGCPGCIRCTEQNVCSTCNGWTNRKTGYPPWCPDRDCPGHQFNPLVSRGPIEEEWREVVDRRAQRKRVRFQLGANQERRCRPQPREVLARVRQSVVERLRSGGGGGAQKAERMRTYTKQICQQQHCGM